MHRLCKIAVPILLIAATLTLPALKANAQVSRDIEVTTDKGEKFHLVFIKGTTFDIYTEADNKKIGSMELRTQESTVIGPDYAANGAAVSRLMAASKMPGHAQSYSGPPIAASTSPATQATPAASNEPPPCPASTLASYWNGTAWTPMRTPEALNGKNGTAWGDALKNPFNPMAGTTSIYRFKGPAAPITTSPSPTFCFYVSQNMSIDFLVGYVDVKSDHREIEMHFKDRGPEKWIPLKRQKPATTKFVGSQAIVTLNDPLPPGQYIVGWMAQFYDFGVN